MEIIIDRGIYPEEFYPVLLNGLLNGTEHNRLYSKNGILYLFKEWNGEYPFDGVVVERIGYIK